MLQQAQVVAEAVSRLRNAAQHAQHPGIELAGIGLAADGEHTVNAHLAGNALIQRLDLFLIAVEQLHKRSLCACRAARPQHAQTGLEIAEVVVIHQQILHPERGALADGHGLRGLKVGIAQRRQVAVFLCKGGKVFQHLDHLFADDFQALL